MRDVSLYGYYLLIVEQCFNISQSNGVLSCSPLFSFIIKLSVPWQEWGLFCEATGCCVRRWAALLRGERRQLADEFLSWTFTIYQPPIKFELVHPTTSVAQIIQ